ncbi:hypothetical protein [Methylobacterium sp. JK268]
MDVEALLSEVRRRIAELELRSTAQAERVAELNRRGEEASTAEAQLWGAIDALTVLRGAQWALQDLRAAEASDGDALGHTAEAVEASQQAIAGRRHGDVFLTASDESLVTLVREKIRVSARGR